MAGGVNARPKYQRSNPGGKDWKKIADLEKEGLALLALKENVPTTATEAALRRHVAEAYAKPLHLRHVAEAEQAYARAKAAAKTADDQALTRLSYADFKFREAKDDGQKWIEEKKAAYQTVGLSAETKLAMLVSGVPGLDYETDGWTVVEKAPELQRRYFERLLGWQGYPNKLQLTWFDKRGDATHLLAVCDKALSVCPEKEREYYRGRRRGYLVQLGRIDEAEKELLENVKKDEKNGSAWMALGEFYANRARRYGAPVDPVVIQKAWAAFDKALACDPKNGGWVRTYIDLAMELSCYDVAKKLLDQHAGTKPDVRYAGYLGDLAYYAGDYETAVKWYDMHKKHVIPQWDRTPPTRQDRIMESLYAVGRYEDALREAENLASWFTWKDYKADVIATLKAKIAEKNTKGE